MPTDAKLLICAPFLSRRDPRYLLWWWSWKHHKQCEEWSQEPRSRWQQRELLEILYRSGPTTAEGIEGFTIQGQQDQSWFMKAPTNILDTAVSADCLESGCWGRSALSAFSRSPSHLLRGQWPPSCLIRSKFPTFLARKAGCQLQIFVSVECISQFPGKLRIPGCMCLSMSTSLISFWISHLSDFSGNSLLLPCGEQAKGPQQEVPSHCELHGYQLVPRVASAGIGVCQPPLLAEHRGHWGERTKEMLLKILPTQSTRNSMSRTPTSKFRLR